MTFPKARLVVSALLFLAWLGFLLYMFFETGTIILSRPQFLLAQVYVVAHVHVGGRAEASNGRATIVEVLWSSDDAGRKLADQTIELPELLAFDRKNWHQGEVKFILPLQKTGAGAYEIVPIPRDPGSPFATHGSVEAEGLFSHRSARRVTFATALDLEIQWKDAGYQVTLTREELRIYPATRATRSQVQAMIQAKK